MGGVVYDWQGVQKKQQQNNFGSGFGWVGGDSCMSHFFFCMRNVPALLNMGSVSGKTGWRSRSINVFC